MIDARDAIHITRGDRMESRQIFWRAKFREMFSDCLQCGIGTTQPAGGTDRDDGLVRNQGSNFFERDKLRAWHNRG